MQIIDKKHSLNSVLSKCIEHFWHLTGEELQSKTNHFTTELLKILSTDNLIIDSTYEKELFINYLAYNYYITHIGDNHYNTHSDEFTVELKIPLFDISNNKCLKVRLTFSVNEDNSLNVENLRAAFLDYNGDSNSLQFLKNKHAKTLKNRYQFINNEQIQNANNFKNFKRHVKKCYRKHFKKNTFINFNVKIVRGNTAGYKYPRINIVYNHSSLSKILKNNLHSQLNITSDNLSNIMPYDDSTEGVSIQNSLPNYQKLIDLNLIDCSRIKQLNTNKRIIQKILKNHNFNSYSELYFDEKKDSILVTDEIELLIYIPLNNVIFIIKTPIDFQTYDINTLTLYFTKESIARRIKDSCFTFQNLLNNPEDAIKLIEVQEY